MTNFKDFLLRNNNTKYYYTVGTVFVILICIIVIIYISTSPDDIIKIPGQVDRPYWPNVEEDGKTYRPIIISDIGVETDDSDSGVFDSWSLTHISHGVIFFFVLMGIRTLLQKTFNISIPISALFLTTFLGELTWEYIENSPVFVKKLQAVNMTKDGDSIVNSIGDILSCLTGFLMTSISPAFALCYIIVTEYLLYPMSLTGLLVNTL